MKKRVIAAMFLMAFLVTGLNAGRRNLQLKAPVCRFMQFYEAAEKSEMTLPERIVYSLAVATSSRSNQAARCANTIVR